MESRAIIRQTLTARIVIPALVAGFVLLGMLVPGIAGAAGYFNVSPDDPPDCIWIRDFLPSSEITITIDDPGTVPTDDYVITRTTNESGDYNFDSEPRPDFSENWQVTVQDGVDTVTHTVLHLEFGSFDVGADSISGFAGLASWPVTVGFWSADLGEYIQRTTTTGSLGEWAVDFTDAVGDGSGPNQGADFKLTDMATVTQGDGGGGGTQRNGWPPNPKVVVFPEDDTVDGWEWSPSAEVTISIDSGGAGGGYEHIAAAQADTDGNLHLELRDVYDITAGDVVYATDGVLDTEMTVTTLQVTGFDLAADTISGTAKAGSEVRVNVFAGSDITTTTDGEGNWTGAAGIDLAPGRDFQVYQQDDDWDRTMVNRHISNPRFGVDPTSEWVHGWEWVVGAGVFVTVDGQPAGTGTVDDWGNINLALNAGIDVFGDSVVSLTDGYSTKTHIVTSLQIDAVNAADDTVSGTAEAGSIVHVWVHGNPNFHRMVTASENGTWTADFTEPDGAEQAHDIVLGDRGEANQEDEDFDQTYVNWALANPRIGVHVDDETLVGWEFAPSAQVTITVDDGEGGYETTTGTDGDGYFEINVAEHIDVQPGHVVTVTDGSVTREHTVTAVAVTGIDADFDIVSGTAVAGSRVVVEVWFANDARRDFVVEGGTWDADFMHTTEPWEQTYDIVSGSRGGASEYDGDGDCTTVRWVLPDPRFWVDSKHEEVWGNDFAPSTTVTITVDGAAGGFEWSTDTDGNGQFGTGFQGEYDMVAGDTVTVSDGQTTKIHMIRELEILAFDTDLETISGRTAEASAALDVDVDWQAYRHVEADEFGYWTADFLNEGDGWGFGDLEPGTTGQVTAPDDDGDSTCVRWHVPDPHFGADPGTEDIFGADFLPSSAVTITVDDGGDGIERTTTTDADGNFGIGLGGEYDVQIGHVVTVTDGATIKQHVILDLAVTDMDTEFDTVSGTSASGATVNVDVYGVASREVTANGSGDWIADFTVGEEWEGIADIGPGTEGEARQHDEDGDFTRASWRVRDNHIGVDPGRYEEVWGNDFTPGAEVTVTIDDLGTVPAPDFTWTGQVNPDGTFGLGLEGEFDIEPGHVVNATDGSFTRELVVADLVVTDIDVDSDTVTGVGAAGPRVSVDVYGMASREVDTDGSGNWTANFAVGEEWEGTADLGPGTEGEARQHDDDGDFTRVAWHVLDPRFTVDPERQDLWGSDFAPSADVTITVDDGEQIHEWTVETDAWGDFGSGFWGEFEMAPGDTIVVTDGLVTKQHIVCDIQVTGVDPDNETVTGTAASFAQVWVDVFDQAGKEVGALENGSWTADFTQGEDWEHADIMLGSEGAASCADDDNDRTQDSWRLASPHISIRPWDDNLGIYDYPYNSPVMLEIDDPGIPGAVDFNRELTTDEWGNIELWVDPAEFDLAAGQTVTVTCGEIVKTHTVTSLSITSIDPDTDTMTGTSDPAFPVQVNNWWYEGEWYPDVDESGNWTLTGMPLDPMNDGAVAQWDEDGDSTDGGWHVPAPRIEVDPAQECVRLNDWPQDAEVTVEIDDPATLANPDVSEVATRDEWGGLELWFDQTDFDIHGGCVITASYGGIVKEHTVTALSITAAQEGMLAGTGTVGILVDLQEFQGWWMGQRSVWPAPDGTWEFYDYIEKGGDGSASQWDEDWDSTRVEWHVPEPAFGIDLTYRNLDGWDWLAGVPATITIDDPGTGLNPDYTYETITDENGGFWFDNEGAGFDFVPGFIVSVTDGVSSKALEVVDVSVTSVDTESDTATGTYAPEAELWVYAWNDQDWQERYVVCDGAGAWTVDFKVGSMEGGPIDLGPGSGVQASVRDDDGDWTRSTWQIPNPRIRVSPVYEDASGWEWPADTTLLLTYDDPGTLLEPDVTTSTVTNEFGDFWCNIAAAGVDIKAGDIITVTDGDTLKEHAVLPVRVLEVDAGADTVRGLGAPDSQVWVSIDSEEFWGGHSPATDGSGNWLADFTLGAQGPTWDIVAGETWGAVNQTDEDGDETWVAWRAALPWFSVAPGTDRVRGDGWALGGEVTVSIDDASNGDGVDWTQAGIPVDEWWGAFELDAARDIEPGDTITVSDGGADKAHVVTALAVLGADIGTDVLYGTTDSHDTVRVGYFPDGWWGPAETSVQPDLTWEYDFTLNDPPLDLALGNEAAVDQVDADGDSTWVDWSIVTPAPQDDALAVLQDGLLTIDAEDLLGNDAYNPGETLLEVKQPPLHGALDIDAVSGEGTYTPDPGYAGSDEFTYALTQDGFESEVATVTITVTAPGDLPDAVDDSESIAEDTPYLQDAPGLLANDSGPAGGVRVTTWTSAAHGTAEVWTDGKWSYTPETDFNGVDTFTYTISDGVWSDTATVTVTVLPVNDAPAGANDNYTTPEDTPLVVAAPGVLGNDSDVDEGDTITAVLQTAPAVGTLDFETDGSFTYTPPLNYNGTGLQIIYKTFDGEAYSSNIRVGINVTAVNDAPVATADTASVNQDAVLTVAAPGVLANDTDVEGSALTASVVTNVTHGTLALAPNGGYTYTPTSGYSGSDSFTYRAYDGSAYSAPASVTITVNFTEVTEVPIAGETRFDTAVAISEEAFPDGADWVVVATGRNWPDALGGSALAGALDGPILLTDTSAMSAGVVAEIERLGATDAIILGGTAAVAQDVETALNGMLGDAHVERIAGANRYLTADAIGARTIDELGAAFDGTAFVVTGANYPDALAAAPLAAGLHWPLFLTKASGISPATFTAMTGVDEVLILGGTAAVPATIETDLVARYGDANITRFYGPTRYSTAVAVATHGVANGLTWDRLALATGEKFPDALAGGVLQGRDGSVMLLTKSNSLDPNVAAVLTANKATIHEVRYLGGLGAITQVVRDAVMAALE